MATKIITVLRDDSFREVLDAFNETSAQEVIFVLPKKSKAFSNENHFSILASEAEGQDKVVSFLTTNAAHGLLATQFGFNLLENSNKDKPTQKPRSDGGNLTVESESQPLNAVNNEGSNEDAQETRAGSAEGEQERDLEEELEQENPDTFAIAGEATETQENGQEENLDSEKSEDVETDDATTDDTEETLPLNTQEKGMTQQVEAGLGDDTDDEVITEDISDYYSSVPEKPSIITAAKMNKVNVPVSKNPEGKTSVKIKKESIKTDNNRVLDEIQSVWQSRRNPVSLYSSPSAKSRKKTAGLFSIFSRGSSRKAMLWGGVGAVVLLGAVLYVFLGKANVIIKPNVHELNFTLKVSVAGSFSELDMENRKIPGQFLELNKKIDAEFESTGEKAVAQKARGVITVYNEYGTAPQTLIATTRFENSEELVFRTLKNITVPGTKVVNGEIIPGSVEVEVIADKAGDLYNVKPGKFSIVAFRERGDTDRYNKYYGVSGESMKGGVVGKAKVVTEEDYINAKKEIEKRAVSEIKQELKNRAAGLVVLDEIKPNWGEIESTAVVDEATENFVLSTDVNISTVGFRESDLFDLIAEYLNSTNDLITFPEKIEVSYGDVKFDENSQVLNFTVVISGLAYSKIDKEPIVRELMGKNELGIREYVQGKDNILSVRVILSPFWVRKVPTDKSKVKLELDYE